MRARLPGQRYRLRRASAADDESCPLPNQIDGIDPVTWGNAFVPGLVEEFTEKLNGAADEKPLQVFMSSTPRFC
jgi:hypothetical protein